MKKYILAVAGVTLAVIMDTSIAGEPEIILVKVPQLGALQDIIKLDSVTRGG